MLSTGQGLQDADRIATAGWDQHDRAGTAMDFIGFKTHGFQITHLDAFSHIFWDGRMYNNRPAAWVSSEHGATQNSILSARGGIFTRGVLLDIPFHRGVKWLEPGEPVHGNEVEEIVADHGLQIREGDALLLRTGNGRRRIESGTVAEAKERAGWHASCLPLFHDCGVALIAADTAQEVVPTGYQLCRRPINAVGSVAMGLWSMDNCNFEELATSCSSFDTYEFALVVSPIPFAGATGSPVNPLACL
jgi:kynurenine formamidase